MKQWKPKIWCQSCGIPIMGAFGGDCAACFELRMQREKVPSFMADRTVSTVPGTKRDHVSTEATKV